MHRLLQATGARGLLRADSNILIYAIVCSQASIQNKNPTRALAKSGNLKVFRIIDLNNYKDLTGFATSSTISKRPNCGYGFNASNRYILKFRV